MKKLYLFLVVLTMIGFVAKLQAQETATVKMQPMGITLDGVGDETAWANADELVITNYLNATPDDDFDFSASFKLAWNDTALFYLVEANDFDIYPNDHWACDGFEMYFQFGNGAATDPNIGDDRENGFFQVPVRLTNEPATGGYQPDATKNGAVTVINAAEDGWVTEGYAAWSQFNDENGDPITAADGLEFKFDMNVQDNDEDPDGGNYPNFGQVTRGYWSSDVHLWEGYEFTNAGVVTLSDEVLDPSAVVSVEKLNNSLFSVYPNPVQDILKIRGEVSSVKIYNILGEKILSQQMTTNNTISVRNLVDGVYFVNMYNNDELLSTSKIVVRR